MADDPRYTDDRYRAPHYQKKGGDLIDEWRRRYSHEIFQLMLLFNIEKYLSRYRNKGDGVNDLRKGMDYMQQLIDDYALEMETSSIAFNGSDPWKSSDTRRSRSRRSKF